MSNKLAQRYHEIETEFEVVQGMATEKIDAEALQKRLAELEAKQNDLRKTLRHLVALSKLRDEAWRTLAYGSDS